MIIRHIKIFFWLRYYKEIIHRKRKKKQIREKINKQKS